MKRDERHGGTAANPVLALRRAALGGPRARAADVLLRDLCRAAWNGVHDLLPGNAAADGTYAREKGRLHGLVQDVVWRPGHAARMAAYRRRLAEGPRRTATGGPFRITFLLEGLNTSGGVLSVAQLAEGLAELGAECAVAVRSPRFYDPEMCRGVTPRFFRDDGDLIRNFPPCDAAVATYWPTMHLLAECFLARPDFTPAYFVQDFEPDFYPEGDAHTRRAALDTYTMTPWCFAKTPWICGRVREAGGQIALVPPGMDLDLFSPRPPSRQPGQKPVVLMMVRPATPQRGLDTLRETLAVLAGAGAAELAEFQAFGCAPEELAALKLPLPVAALGVLPNAALPQAYSDACLFLDTSHFHGFGRTAAEAMACGIPCVLTDSGGVRHFAEDGKNCLMTPPGDAPGLADRVLRLLRDGGARARLAARCRGSVAGFGLAASAEKTLEFLRRAAGDSLP